MDKILKAISNQKEESMEIREEISVLKECMVNNNTDKGELPCKKRIPIDLSVSSLIYLYCCGCDALYELWH